MSRTVWTVTYQDDPIEALEPEQVRVFEERDTARQYALMMASGGHNYVNMYESEVNKWGS